MKIFNICLMQKVNGNFHFQGDLRNNDKKGKYFVITNKGKESGKEFPDMRQSERRTEFIRVGDAVRTVVQLKGEPTSFVD